MGTVATKLPPTVVFNEAQAEGAGQQLSVGKQWQSEAIAEAARATREPNVQAFIVGRICEGMRLKLVEMSIPLFYLYKRHSPFLGPFQGEFEYFTFMNSEIFPSASSQINCGCFFYFFFHRS